jgi:hypothetical protein
MQNAPGNLASQADKKQFRKDFEFATQQFIKDLDKDEYSSLWKTKKAAAKGDPEAQALLDAMGEGKEKEQKISDVDKERMKTLDNEVKSLSSEYVKISKRPSQAARTEELRKQIEDKKNRKENILSKYANEIAPEIKTSKKTVTIDGKQY